MSAASRNAITDALLRQPDDLRAKLMQAFTREGITLQAGQRAKEKDGVVDLKVFAVLSASRGERLATIRWYGPWRQYTLYPEPATIWNADCLRAVDTLLAGLNREQEAKR